jgi:hypothetical protein
MKLSMNIMLCINNTNHRERADYIRGTSTIPRAQKQVLWIDPFHISLELLHFPLQHTSLYSSHLAILFTGLLVVITFASDTCCWLT